MVIVTSDLVGYSHSPFVNPAERYDRLDAVVVCFLVEITHAYLRDFCCVSIRYFVVRCTVFFGLGAKSADDGFGARSTCGEPGYSEPEHFLSVFLLRLLLFPSGERKSCPCCYLTRRESI